LTLLNCVLKEVFEKEILPEFKALSVIKEGFHNRQIPIKNPSEILALRGGDQIDAVDRNVSSAPHSFQIP
jgi:hypothetical protein